MGRASPRPRFGDELQQHDGARALSATAACSTAEHPCVNGRGSPSHQRFDCPDRTVAVAMAVLRHEGRDDMSASAGLQWFHGVCPVEACWLMRGHNFALASRTLRAFPKSAIRKRLVTDSGSENALVAGDLEPNEPCDFSGRKFRKASTGARSGKARDPVVLRSLPPPIPPGREFVRRTVYSRERYPYRPPLVKRPERQAVTGSPRKPPELRTDQYRRYPRRGRLPATEGTEGRQRLATVLEHTCKAPAESAAVSLPLAGFNAEGPRLATGALPR